MKVRHGFVSNSSTSSFLCNICGTIAAERDLGIEEAEMVCCLNDHTFCTSHENGFDFDADRSLAEKKKILLSDSSWAKQAEEPEANIDCLYSDWAVVTRYEMPPALCPFCQLKRVTDDLLLLYLFETMGQSREQIVEQISTKFDNYDEFRKFVKS